MEEHEIQLVIVKTGGYISSGYKISEKLEFGLKLPIQTKVQIKSGCRELGYFWNYSSSKKYWPIDDETIKTKLVKSFKKYCKSKLGTFRESGMSKEIIKFAKS